MPMPARRGEHPAGDLAPVGDQHRIDHAGQLTGAAGVAAARDLGSAPPPRPGRTRPRCPAGAVPARPRTGPGPADPPTRSSKALAARMIRLPTGGSRPARRATAGSGSGRSRPPRPARPACSMTLAPRPAMRRWSSGEASTVAPPGMGSASDSWPMSCMSAAYSSSQQFRLAHAEFPADGDGQPAHPVGMAVLDVAADLGDPGQRADRLQVGGRGSRRTGGTRSG